MIDNQLILETFAEQKVFSKGDIIIREGDLPHYFYYLMEGELSVSNLTEDGKEFLQHKVHANSFFGEPAVLLNEPMPGNVEVYTEKAKLLKINRESFLEYMRKNPDSMLRFTMSIAQKALVRSNSLKNIVFLNPEERVYNHLIAYKKEITNSDEKLAINLTRKEISNMTGLRIETIIRTIKKMEKEGKLEIKKGKVYF